VRFAGDTIVGVEALLRWRHPTAGWRTPDEFLDIAEDSGLIVPIGEWVLGEALEQLEAWRSLLKEPVWVSVNISGRQLGDAGMQDILSRHVVAGTLPSELLRFELTESMVIEHVPAVDADIARAVSLGIRIGIDDFGTGHSSLTRLQHLPISFLKIDRSFISALADRPVGADQRDPVTLVAAIIQLSRTLGMDIIAEGVETTDQADVLVGLGCPYGQGYLYGRPTAAPAMTSLLLGPE